MNLKIFRSLILLLLLIPPFVGSDCTDLLEQQVTCNGGDISGNWVLINHSGSNHDVCPGEIVLFPSNTGGSATLQCPNSIPTTKDYTVSNATLTYTSSGVKYCIQKATDTLIISSTNLSSSNSRTLTYFKQ